MTSLVGFVGSIINDGLQRLDDEDIDQVSFFLSFFSFFLSFIVVESWVFMVLTSRYKTGM